MAATVRLTRLLHQVGRHAPLSTRVTHASSTYVRSLRTAAAVPFSRSPVCSGFSRKNQQSHSNSILSAPLQPFTASRQYGIPTNMGFDHMGVVVPNAQEAADFLIDVFDAEFDWEVKREPEPRFREREWDTLFNVHPETYMPHVIMLKCGEAHLTQYIELFEFVSPDQDEVPRKGERGWLRFSDICNSYISFTVRDLDAVMKHVKEVVVPKWEGVRFVQDPPMSFPLRGEVCRSTFLVSPFGMWIELTEWSESRHQGVLVKALQGREQYDHPDVGKHINDLSTPSYMVDLDNFEHNAGLMRDRFKQAGMKWCPTCKGHKSPTLAKKLLKEYGCEGVIVLTLQEAEDFAKQGIDDIYIANEIVGKEKLKKLSLLAKCVKKLRVNIEDEQGLQDLSDAIEQWEITTSIDVMIELNIGHNRCGVTPQESVAIAKLAKKLEIEKGTVRLAGICGYEGHTPVLAPEEKTKETLRCHSVLSEAKQILEKEGIEVGIVSGGGSSNYMDCIKAGVLNEIQAGGGAITDLLYAHKANLASHGHKIGGLVCGLFFVSLAEQKRKVQLLLFFFFFFFFFTHENISRF